MRFLFRYPNSPLLHRELLNLGLNRVLLHLVVLQFLVQCLDYENNAPCRELVDSCDK